MSFELSLAGLRKRFENCPCGRKHDFNLRDLRVGHGITGDVGKILKENGFGKSLYVVADKNTLAAADGALGSVIAAGFEVKTRVYDDLRVADMREVERIEKLIEGADGVVSIGTGSLNDIARLAAARKDKKLCLVATAPSMDGFASYSAPITDGCFKITYPAKTPEVIVADTAVLAAAPAYLKSAGFGDMVGKYVGLIDWKTAAIVGGEYYCERVAALVREATDSVMALADRVTQNDEETAAALFYGLIGTGIAMSLVGNSRPASGTEHILSHFWECKKLLDGKLSDFHGKKVGVATLIIMEKYEKFASYKAVKIVPENIDWERVKEAYGPLYAEVEKLNKPPITHEIDQNLIAERWPEIVEAVRSVPTKSEIEDRMKRAGCATKTEEIVVDEKLRDLGIEFHPHMRHRISLLRLSYLFEEAK